jgi:GGDEF domain-containing protein
MVIDLDHFKTLNDRHGHQAGDEVMEDVGTALRTIVRASDLAGRCDHAADGPALIRAADRALYVAKADGRNRVRAAVADPAPVES